MKIEMSSEGANEIIFKKICNLQKLTKKIKNDTMGLKETFKNTKEDSDYNMAFTKNEDYYIIKGSLSKSNIKDWHFFLKRNLTIKELKVLELCAENGILLSENDFKRNS